MRVIREWIHRLRATLGPGRRDDEEEPRLHLELSAKDGRRRGVDPDGARCIVWIEAGVTP